MSVLKVRAAIEAAIATMTPKLAIAWENSDFVPQPSTPYQRINLLPAPPDNPTFGDGYYREIGIMQITLSYPNALNSKGGTGPLSARADLIRNVFFRGASFVQDDVTVIVQRTPWVGAGRPDGDRFEIPIRITYFANVYTPQ